MIVSAISDLRTQLMPVRKSGLKVGFVPTMGALHPGHLKLIAEAKERADFVVVSVFVNPTQFNNNEDLGKYPRREEIDAALALGAGANLVWTPSESELYPHGYRYRILETDLSLRACGAFRPGHFEGMLTIVMKLFNAVRPDVAVFGEKDFQQLLLIRGMVQEFFMDIDVLGVPTVREVSGLALSSRNERLSTLARDQIAPEMYRILNSSANKELVLEELNKIGLDVEYLEDWEEHGRRLAAVWCEGVRLIDNVVRKEPAV